MTSPVISVEHLTKQYDLGMIGTGTISRDLNRWWARARKQPDPYTRIGQKDTFERFGESILALDDVSFQVQQGEALGIIGRNGAGKSTLLKILSRVTAPTSGSVKIKGRIGSLLEVGTGFHPELTGRENVYLNGAILGMKKGEITRRFDEIVDFSGVAKFIDTPVKRYSSGMYVRLAFAVAAHLESEILIVDEVLAVGDIEFQKKCLGKMGDVAGHEGRTVLFVSHNMDAIQRLCPITCLIKQGKLEFLGQTQDAINEYLSSSKMIRAWVNENNHSIHPIHLNSVRILDSSGNECTKFVLDSKILIELRIKVDEIIKSSHIHLMVDYKGTTLFRTFDTDNYPSLLSSREPGEYRNLLTIDTGYLKPGKYDISIDFGIRPSLLFEKYRNLLSFEIVDPEGAFDHGWSENRDGVIRAPVKWDFYKISDLSSQTLLGKEHKINEDI